MSMQRQAIAKIETNSAGQAVDLIIDLGLYPTRHVELYLETDTTTTFDILGSIDGTSWRDLGIPVNVTAGQNVHQGFDNGYRYVRVTAQLASPNEAGQLIEVAGA